MPTRDRPALFAQALASVLAQTGVAYEVVIVIDGLSADHAQAYHRILADAGARLGDRLKQIELPRRAHGHGPSFALNTGALAATGDYLAFLDDDDVWIDAAHLARAEAALAGAQPPVDLYLSNQRAWCGDVPDAEMLWLGPLADQLRRAGRSADASRHYTVSRAELLQTPGFAHVNTLIVRRALWLELGGMDEMIRWEGDRELYLRLIDVAGVMLFSPCEIARHNVPDPAQRTNVTTQTSPLQRHEWQARVFAKVAAHAQHAEIRAHARQHHGYALQKIAEDLAQAGDWAGAAHYARAGHGARPSPAGLGRSLYFTLRSWGAPRQERIIAIRRHPKPKNDTC
ncbi:MAG: glycosyltransferase [Alphaproteobacteria bacterium]|nr:glycosyltransferase [Alphaproteobacteria bacterium]MDE2340404.1 glycosyltransferase [Alphaproteobacteria bacterium]